MPAAGPERLGGRHFAKVQELRVHSSTSRSAASLASPYLS
jgi:hypothetical protein